MGGRIDAKWLATLLIPAWITLLCSYRWERCWRMTIGLGLLAQTVAVIFALVNFGFYAFYGTPISPVIFGLFQDDTKAILLTLLEDWPIVQYLLVALFAIILPLLAAGLLPKRHRYMNGWRRFSALALIGTLMLALIIRGSLGTFPLRYQNLTVSPIAFVNTTIPNGMVAMYEAYKGQKQLEFKGGIEGGLREMGFAQAASAEAVLREVRPPLTQTAVEEKPRHVVLAVMESMGRELFDLHAADNNMLGALEGELQDAVLFRHGLAVGSGTFPSLEGLLFNTPLTPLTQTRYGRQPFAFSNVTPYREAGFRTVFLTAGPEKWRQLDETFKTQGFDEIIGASMIQAKYPQAQAGTWGVPDEWMFRYGADLLKEADQRGERVFLVMLSVTNHPPFAVPSTYTARPVNPHRLPDYVVAERDSEKTLTPFKTYQYSCHALGEFVGALRTQALLSKTLVAATGDHNARFYNYQMEGNWHHALGVPILFWLPDGQKKLVEGVDTDRWVSHIDIFPTLDRLALGTAPERFEGRYLFGEPDFDLALTYFGLGKNGMAIGRWGAVALNAEGATACYRWQGDKLIPEVPCSSELDRIGRIARAQRALADYQIRADLLK
ncbi:phosphoglycerol transferase [gut metagenome]|uniref:Phosphoglycerol transferase n=1 Tax=gut metagenome TaxID=749906 RepID=J9D4Y6_9ZZZZ